MTFTRITTALTILCAAFIVYLGLSFSYVIDPHGAVTGFGLPESARPRGDAAAFMNIKGARELGMGLALTALLVARHHRALGWTLLAFALIPVADAMIVLGYDGSVAAAIGIHLATAAVVAVTGVLQLRVAAKTERAVAGTATGTGTGTGRVTTDTTTRVERVAADIAVATQARPVPET